MYSASVRVCQVLGAKVSATYRRARWGELEALTGLGREAIVGRYLKHTELLWPGAVPAQRAALASSAPVRWRLGPAELETLWYPGARNRFVMRLKEEIHV
jgi:hypothetical protein